MKCSMREDYLGECAVDVLARTQPPRLKQRKASSFEINQMPPRLLQRRGNVFGNCL